jgi:hypothetical protein
LWNSVRNNLSRNLYFHISVFSIRDCAPDLIRDISDFVFEELVKYKLYDNANHNQRTNVDERISSIGDDGENENKYQIELAESESRPLNLYVELKKTSFY